MTAVGRLGLFESTAAMPVATRGPGTTEQKFLTEGNSLISTLFVQGVDPGTTLKINWWDSGAGTDQGERYDLAGHALITGPVTVPFSNRIVVTRIHNKPVLEAIVTGGNATFGIYTTVVSAFATESPSNVGQGQVVDLIGDKAGAIALYDPGSGKWYFAQGTGGIQSVNVVGGTITTTDLMTSALISGAAAGLPFGNTADIFSYTAGGTIMIPSIVAGGDSYGAFELFVRGTSWGVRRNSWQQRQVAFDVGVIKLLPGDTLRLAVTNASISGGVADYEGYAYYGT